MAYDAPTSRAEPGVGLVLAIVLPTALMALWPSLSSLWAFWGQVHDYQYGYLIAPIALAWLVLAAWPMRARPAQPSLIGSGLLTGVLIVWLVALRANSAIGHQLLFPAGIWFAVLAATGWSAARKLLAPVAYLYFSVPLWDFLLPSLQWMTVHVAERALMLIDVPATVYEFEVRIPQGTFWIIEGCSGKRFFMVTLAVAVLAATVNHIRGWRFLAFLAACALMALLANWIRVFTVIYVGYLTDLQHYFVAVEHKSLGNAIFVVLLASVFLLAHAVAARVVAAPGAGEIKVKSPSPELRLTGSLWRAAPPVAMLIATFGLTQVWAHEATEQPALGPLPVAAGTWQGPLPPTAAWEPSYPAAAGERRATYRSASGAVELYVNVYGKQRQGEELVSYGNTFLAPGNWKRGWPLVSRSLGIDLTSIEARSPDGSLWLIAHTHEVAGVVMRSRPTTQLAYGIMSILSPAPSGVVALAVRCEENCEAARSLVASFWDDMSGSILAMVPGRLTADAGK